MLLPENIHPERTLIYNGAVIIKALKKIGEVQLLDLYLEARKNSSLTMPLFVLSLDWLYLADCVNINEQGKVALCS